MLSRYAVIKRPISKLHGSNQLKLIEMLSRYAVLKKKKWQ